MSGIDFKRNVAGAELSAVAPIFAVAKPVNLFLRRCKTGMAIASVTLDGGVNMPGIASIHEFLNEAHVPYAVVPHRPAFTARTEALATHVPGRDWAKVVICFIDDEPVEAVIPATSHVNLGELLELAGGSSIRLAEEEELRRLFPECEIGAMPPFGPLYGQSVYVDAALATEFQIAFNAGTHQDAIAMRWNDFARTVDPVVGRFAE
jgi:Ala-tRNA(Pro) deacylase